MSVGGGGEPKSVIDGKRLRVKCLRPAFLRQEKRSGEQPKEHEFFAAPLRGASGPRFWARRDGLAMFDCAAAEAYYVGDTATMDGRDESKAVILKVEL
jgi:hypothetical protein